MDIETNQQNGASSFHYGIDIAAPTGANIISSTNGKVVYTNFNGANGFTVQIENEEYLICYSHVSPNFIVKVGEYVNKGQVIAQVGPKYINNIPNNPYKDSTGRSTNGATTRSTFTFLH